MAAAPPKSLRADWTDASRTHERMSPRQAKSRVVNSGRKRSEGRHDIGYTRSGGAREASPCNPAREPNEAPPSAHETFLFRGLISRSIGWPKPGLLYTSTLEPRSDPGSHRTALRRIRLRRRSAGRPDRHGWRLSDDAVADTALRRPSARRRGNRSALRRGDENRWHSPSTPRMVTWTGAWPALGQPASVPATVLTIWVLSARAAEARAQRQPLLSPCPSG